jgi:GNAT superfamily N-acetyltransferase
MLNFATTPIELSRCFPVLQQLRPHLQQETFVEYAEELRAEGYQFAYLESQGAVVCVAGFKIAKNLFIGKHLYIEDLVTAEAARSQNFGTVMMQGLIALAKQEACQAVHLDSGVQRHGAHKFYLNQNMKINCHHFFLALE